MKHNEIKKKMKNEFLVLVDEEYGWKEWFWFPTMDEKELVNWWKNLEFVGRPLEGEVIEVDDESSSFFHQLWKEDSFFQLHIHDDADSHLKQPKGEGYVYHKGYIGDFNPESYAFMSLEEMRLVHKNWLDERKKQ